MALPVTITGISTAVAPVGPFKGGASSLTLASIVPGSLNNPMNFGPSAVNELSAQTFTVATGGTTITSVTPSLSKFGSPTDNVQVDIYAVDGSHLPTGASLGTATTSGSALTTTSTNTVITFATPIAVVAGTQYAMVLSRTGALNGLNYYSIGGAGTNIDATQGSSSYSSGAWTAFGSNDYGLIVTGTRDDAYYFFGRDGTTATTLQAYKATDPTTSWATQATKTGFTTAILNIAACQASNVIHMLVQDGTASTSLATKYVSYDMAADTFLTTVETVSAAVAVTGQIAGAGAGASLVVRSNGEVVCFYSGVQTKTSGTFRSRVYYRRRTALNTYGTETEVDANTAVDNNNPLVVLGASDRLHFLFFNQTNTIQRHLTSANVLGTAASTGATTAVQDVCRYDDAGTIRHVGFTAAQAVRWASADNPTVTAASITFGTPVRTVDDGGNPFALYQSSADSDLYVKISTDDGATFGTAISALVGTVASVAANLSKNQTEYTRGQSVVIPYVVNDNGTLKYNEYTIKTLDAWNAQDKSANVTLSNSDKTATLSSSVSGGVRSTTKRANGTAGKYYVEYLIGSGAAPRVGFLNTTNAVGQTNTLGAFVLNGSAGSIFVNNVSIISNAALALAANDVACAAWDAAAEKVWFRVNNGLWNNDAAADPATGTNGVDCSFASSVDHSVWLQSATSGADATIRTEVADFTYYGPVGFTSWMGETLPLAPPIPDRLMSAMQAVSRASYF